MTEPASAPPEPEELARLGEEVSAALAAVADRRAYEALRLEWLGRKDGRLRHLLEAIPRAADKRAFGAAVHRLKEAVEAALAAADERLAAAERERAVAAAAVDVTLPGRRVAAGALHPVSRVVEQIERIFRALGYSVASGPEVEQERYNFGLLNFPEDHPARDAQDTFFMRDGRLLRTHTSPVQIRTMLARRPPIRVIIPGRVYRNDNDLRHSPMFHQVEGLAVGEGITMADLKGTLAAFLSRLFAPDIGVRLRPSFFPFTEPSCEVDVTCGNCRGAGCAVCSETGWMEILGAGMVDPRVLEGCGIDPDRYSGFAFGMGLDRVAMNVYGIPNIRMLFDNDERLLRQVREV